MKDNNKSFLPYGEPSSKPKIDLDIVIFLNTLLALYVGYSIFIKSTFNLIGFLSALASSRTGEIFYNFNDYMDLYGGLFITKEDHAEFALIFKLNIVLYLLFMLLLYKYRSKDSV